VGYVAAAQGMRLLEKPKAISRSEGGVHVHGNPHVTCSPINMKVAVRNITTGLIKVDPEGTEAYRARRDRLLATIDKRLFGHTLVSLLGGKTLCAMAEKEALIPFLEKHRYRGRPLIDYMGGWMKKMFPLRGKPIVTYHKNWIYFVKLFGLEEAGTIEPKPGIPPSPKHVTQLVSLMRERKIHIVLAANYFDEQKVMSVAGSVDAQAVIVPLYVGGSSGVDDYFKLVDHWTDELMRAARKAGVIVPDEEAQKGMEVGAPDV
jgi:ABC-type Zn uptake system ZnuABC Zn-binding protein ZnuA